MSSDAYLDFLRLLGWAAAMGAGQLLLWALGIGVVFLFTFLVPGTFARALVRAPLLMGLVLLLVPRLRAGPWGWHQVLLGLGAAALGAWLLERRWSDDDADVDWS